MEKARHEELNDQFSELSQAQQIVRTGLVNLEGDLAHTTVGIDSVAQEQAALQQLIQDNGTTLSDRISLTIEKQEKMQSDVEGLHRINQAASDRIAALAGTQVALKETAHQDNEKLLDQLTTLTSNHGQLHSNVNSVRELIQKVAGNLTSVADGQASAYEALQAGTKALTENTTAVQQSLTALQVQVSQLADANRQAVATLAATVSEEAALLETIRNHSEELTGQVAILSENQQANLDTLNTTTREAAGDLATVSLKQGQLQQAIQTSREDLLGRLACVADAQHQSMERFAAAQVEIQSMLAGVASLAKTVADIQESCQKHSEELAQTLEGQQQQQIDFESKVSQAFTAVTDCLSEIVKMRDILHGQADPSKEGTQAGTNDIAWAAEQLRRHAAASKQSREDVESSPIDYSSGVPSE